MSRNIQNTKIIKRYKTSLTKPRGIQGYFTHNTFYNPNTLKISIKTFNKSIEHLHSVLHTKPIVRSQNQTIKSSNDNKKNRAKHITSAKDPPNNGNVNSQTNTNAHTNYIINNFTLSAKNLINNQGQTDVNQICDKRKREIDRLNNILSTKEQEIEGLKNSLQLKEIKIIENLERFDNIHAKYSKFKEKYKRTTSKNKKLNEFVIKLKTHERKLRKIREFISENKLYIEVKDNKNNEENIDNNYSENKDIILQELEDYLKDKDIESFQYLYPNDNITNNTNESSLFIPLTIEPVKSLKRLEIIPKLNFNKLKLRSGSDNDHDRERVQDKDTDTDPTLIHNKKPNEADKGQRKKLSINVKLSNGTQKEYLNILNSYHETENHETEQIENSKDNDKSDIAKNANIPNNSINAKGEEIAQNKFFFTQNHKSKSFSGQLSKMVKNDIYTHIQNKYNKICHKFK